MKKLYAVLLAMLWLGSARAEINQGKKILIVTTNVDYTLWDPNDHTYGVFMPEVADFYSKIHKYGFNISDIDIVSLNGGKVPLCTDVPGMFKLPLPAADGPVLHAKLNNTLKPSDIDPSKYNVIYYAGGVSTLIDYPTSTAIGDIAAKIYQQGGIVAAVCDGISGLVPIKLNGKPLVDGVKVTTNWYNKANDGIDIAELLGNNGASVDQQQGLMVDKRVVTGQDVRPVEVAEAVMNLLGSTIFPNNVDDIAPAKAFACFPNPAGQWLQVNAPAGTRFLLLDVTGKTAVAGVLPADSRIAVTDIAAGQYFLSVAGNTQLLVTIVH